MPKWSERFDESELAKRINMVESMAQLHGVPPYHGQTIQQFIKELLTDLIESIPDTLDVYRNGQKDVFATISNEDLKSELKDKYLKE